MGVCSSASLLPTPAHEADNPKETAGPAAGQGGDLGIRTMRRSRDLPTCPPNNAEISGSDGPRPILPHPPDSGLQTPDSGLQPPASSLWTQDPGLQTRAHLSFLQGEEFWPPPTSRRWSRDSAPVSVFSVPAPPPTLGRWSDDCSSRGNPIHPVGGRREHIRNHRETSKSSITAPPV